MPKNHKHTQLQELMNEKKQEGVTAFRSNVIEHEAPHNQEKAQNPKSLETFKFED